MSPRVIYKYVLNPGRTYIQLPRFSNVLCAHVQDGNVCIWVEQYRDPRIENRQYESFEERSFVTVPTGVDLPENENTWLDYINTVFMKDDYNQNLVFHVYEVVPVREEQGN